MEWLHWMEWTLQPPKRKSLEIVLDLFSPPWIKRWDNKQVQKGKEKRSTSHRLITCVKDFHVKCNSCSPREDVKKRQIQNSSRVQSGRLDNCRVVTSRWKCCGLVKQDQCRMDQSDMSDELFSLHFRFVCYVRPPVVELIEKNEIVIYIQQGYFYLTNTFSNLDEHSSESVP